MSCLKSHSYLNSYADCFLNRKTCLFLNIFFESNAVNKLHNNVVDAILISNIIHINNIWMHKSGGRLRLYAELGYKVLILGKFLFENLNCNQTIQFMIFCFINIGHSAGTYFFKYLISVADNHSYLNH